MSVYIYHVTLSLWKSCKISGGIFLFLTDVEWKTKGDKASNIKLIG